MSGIPAERVHVVVTDLAVEGASAATVAETATHFGRLEVVVANAGTSEPSDIEDFDPQVWKRLRSINLDAMVELAAASAVHLKRIQGNFLAISSIAGIRGEWGMFAYTTTKGPVNALVRSLALDPRCLRRPCQRDRSGVHSLPTHRAAIRGRRFPREPSRSNPARIRRAA